MFMWYKVDAKEWLMWHLTNAKSMLTWHLVNAKRMLNMHIEGENCNYTPYTGYWNNQQQSVRKIQLNTLQGDISESDLNWLPLGNFKCSPIWNASLHCLWVKRRHKRGESYPYQPNARLYFTFYAKLYSNLKFNFNKGSNYN